MINFASVDAHVGYSINEQERGLTVMGKFTTEFGPTREQRESKRLYDKLIIAPMNAYMEAMRLYLAGRYWDAGFAFGKVIALYPNFHLNDKATFYLSDCYTKLQMYDIARGVLKDALSEYTTSEQRPKFLYGLENLDYIEDKYEDALKNHAFISNLYAESEISPDADYLAGQIHFKRRNYNAAEQLMSKIEPQSPTYKYAQYTLSIINVENTKIKNAIQNLRAVVEDTTSDLAELLLQDAANNKLGQLYFEEVDLRKAVEAFDRVPQGSEYGPDAMLGIAWSWIKVNQPEVASRVIDQLIATAPKSPLIPEANLVKGYALMLQKMHREAIGYFEKSIELCKTAYATEADLAEKKRKLVSATAQFAPVAQAIVKNTMRKPTDKGIEERTAMKVEYDKYANESQSYFDFSMVVEDNKKFFKRKDQILLDAEYALAKATKIAGVSKESKIIDNAKEKSQKIDTELEQLQKQLEQLNKK
jgi:TolA-binding protein